MSDGVGSVDWEQAHRAGQALLAGTERLRLPGAEPGVELSALDFGGDGPLVVIHHANGFCAAPYAPIAARLRPRYRVVALDGRGHGDATAVPPGGEPDPYDWGTLGRDADRAVLALLERTGHDRVALGIGHSLGGAMIAGVAARLPERVERLLLCDPVMLPPPSPAQRARHRGPNPIAEASRRRRDRFPDFAAAYDHCRTRPLFADFTPEALALYVSEGMHETETGEVALKCAREIEAAVFDAGGEGAVADLVDRIAARVLFVHAGRGNFSAEYYDELAARMPDARVERRDVDHLFPFEVPEIVIELLEQGLDLRID